MNITNNLVLSSTLTTTSRGAMITSYLEGAGRLIVSKLKIEASVIKITKELISCSLLIAESDAAIIEIS